RSRGRALLDPGVAWFLTELLIFSALFVAYRRRRPARADAHPALRLRHLLVAMSLIAGATFLVHLVAPTNSYQPLGLHLYLCPQCVARFWLGCLAAENGWLASPLASWARRFALAVAVAAAVLMTWGWILAGASSDFRPFFEGWTWPALGAAIIEGMFSVSLTLLLVDLFRRHVSGQGRLARAMSRDAYAAFIIQHPVLVVGALAL